MGIVVSLALVLGFHPWRDVSDTGEQNVSGFEAEAAITDENNDVSGSQENPEEVPASGSADISDTELPAQDNQNQEAAESAAVLTDAANGLAVLEENIALCISDLSSRWDVYVERLSDGCHISCARNLPDDGKMISASIIKLFVMGAVYEQISIGESTERLAANDLELMITISDNDATNRLIYMLGDGDSGKGFKAVNDFAESIGCSHTELNRLMLDWRKGLENYTSSADCATLLKLIYNRECINRDYSEKMMALLKAQEKNEGLLWHIPEGVEVASKPGFISGVSVGDVGIVFAESAEYIICIISNEPHTDAGAKQMISNISDITYTFFTSSLELPTAAAQISVEPSAFVRVQAYIPSIYVDLVYSTDENFTNTVIYDFTEAYLRYGTVEKLIKVQKELNQIGYSLKIWDAFRPVSSQYVMWEMYPDPNYVANPYKGFSSHSRGNTVDVTLVTEDGKEVIMPSQFDDFSSLADRDYSDVTEEQANHAILLENIMIKYDFSAYSKEWWHYTDADEYEVDQGDGSPG